MTRNWDPLEPFLQWLGSGAEFGQLWIQPVDSRHELRHVADREQEIASLNSLELHQLREIARTDIHGAFRPLKAAPDLRSGWRSVVPRESLAEAISRIYPGGLADWLAVKLSGNTLATHFREYVGRQTGIYRTAQSLSDPEAATIIRACCGASLCLKRRVWTVDGLPEDPPSWKSVIPCLEPCAVTLEMFRRAARMKGDEPVVLRMAPADVESLEYVLKQVGNSFGEPSRIRVGDVGAAENPRRILLALEHFQGQVSSWKGAQASKATEFPASDVGGVR